MWCWLGVMGLSSHLHKCVLVAFEVHRSCAGAAWTKKKKVEDSVELIQ